MGFVVACLAMRGRARGICLRQFGKASLWGLFLGGKFWHLFHINLDSNHHKQCGINSNGGFPSIFSLAILPILLFWHHMFGFAMASPSTRIISQPNVCLLPIAHWHFTQMFWPKSLAHNCVGPIAFDPPSCIGTIKGRKCVHSWSSDSQSLSSFGSLFWLAPLGTILIIGQSLVSLFIPIKFLSLPLLIRVFSMHYLSQ
jgi:hypothetical protein